MDQTILDKLPHRYPFLFIDRVVSIDPKNKAQAIKAVSINEPFFQGHFPGFPVMPGVLLAEAMAQTAALCCIEEEGDHQLGFLTGIKSLRLKEMVRPGDLLEIQARIQKERMGFIEAAGEIRCQGKLVAKGVLTFTLK